MKHKLTRFLILVAAFFLSVPLSAKIDYELNYDSVNFGMVRDKYIRYDVYIKNGYAAASFLKYKYDILDPNDSVTSFTIPATVYYAGKEYKVTTLREVEEDKIKEILAPDIDTVENRCFIDMSNIERIDIPNARFIGDRAFSGCSSLREINAPEVKYIGKYTFYNDSSLLEASFPKLVEADISVFYNCVSLKKAYLPEISSLGEYFFGGCSSLNLDSAYIPKVTDVGICAFYATNSTEVSLPNIKTAAGAAFSYCRKLRKVSLPGLTYLASDMFLGCDSLTDVSLPNVVEVGDRAFSSCGLINVTSDMMPKVRQMHFGVFRYCPRLKSVELNSLEILSGDIDKVEGDGRGYAFCQCKALEKVVLPKVKYLCNLDFWNCESLKDLELPSLDSLLLDDYPHTTGLEYFAPLERVVLTNSRNGFIANGMNYVDLSSAKNIVLYGDVTGGQYFSLPNFGVVSVSPDVSPTNNFTVSFDTISFTATTDNDVVPARVRPSAGVIQLQSGCTGFTTRNTLSMSSLREINADDNSNYLSSTDGVLYNKNKTRLICVPQANTLALRDYEEDSISTKMFTVPETVTELGDYAMYKYYGMSRVKIGSAVKTIGRSAMNGAMLLDVDFSRADALTSIGDSAFFNLPQPMLARLRLPAGVESIGNGAFENCRFIRALEVPGQSLKTVGSNAFAGMTWLNSIALPDGVETIGDSAFKGNNRMQYFTVPASCTSIGAHAFKSTSLKLLNIPVYNETLAASLDSAFDGATALPQLNVPAASRGSYSGFALAAETDSIKLPAQRYVAFARSYPVSLTTDDPNVHFFVSNDELSDADENGVAILSLSRLDESNARRIPANKCVVLFNEGAAGTTTSVACVPVGMQSAWKENWLKASPAVMRIDRYVNAKGFKAADGDDVYENYYLTTTDDYPEGIFKPFDEVAWFDLALLEGENCYMSIPRHLESANIKMLKINVSDDDTDGINSIADGNRADDGLWYRLDGTAVEHPAAGLYIHNGKKVIVR